MGACCATEGQIDIVRLVKVQRCVRRWLAFKQKEKKKREYLYKISGKSLRLPFQSRYLDQQHLINPSAIELRKPTVDGRPGEPLFTPDQLLRLEQDQKGRYISRYYEDTVDMDDPDTKKSYQGQW